MPAGDLVLLDYQVELRATLTGTGSVLADIGPGGITGLGHNVRSDDTVLQHAAGSYAGRDFSEPRILTVDYLIKAVGPTGPADAMTRLSGLLTMWAPSETVDLPLHFRLPGVGRRVVLGRPRGLVEDTSDVKFGLIRALATFVCGNPAIVVA